MEKDFFKFLPSEITTDILLRLPLRSIAISKCVRKSWLDLLKSDDFVKFHLSRSAAALAVSTEEGNSSRCTVFEFEDEIDVERSHDHHLKHLTSFSFPHEVSIEGSANGLLFLHKYGMNAQALYVCNPISRECIQLSNCPQEFSIYGFGASRISGQHKVVQIIPGSDIQCRVYTLGTGSWRRVEPPRNYGCCIYGVLVNGNLHWLLSASIYCIWCISCFDLETECFSLFYAPPLRSRSLDYYESLSVLRDCLCVCDNALGDEIVIWLMKEYGDEKSWTKEYVVNLNRGFNSIEQPLVFPMKVFKDGDILIEWDQLLLSYYSNKTKTTREIEAANPFGNSMLLTPSFLSLKSFRMENVISL